MSMLRLSTRLSNCFSSFLPSNIVISNRHYARVKEIKVLLKKPTGEKFSLLGEADNACTVLDMVNDTGDVSNFGVCGGTPGCSTCHIIFHPEDYKKLSNPPDEVERSILRNTQEAGPNSRLACQVLVEEFMDGIEIMLPSNVKDIRDKKKL